MRQGSFWLGRWSLIVVLSVAAGGVAAWYAGTRTASDAQASEPRPTVEAKTPRPVSVDVVSPQPGGIDRRCTQPGSVEPFEVADIYAKVSGYLVEQKVDIGSRVTAGDVLARLSIPEYEKQVLQDEADVTRAEAKVEQVEAAIVTAEADYGAAKAAVALARVEIKSKTSYRMYRQKQRERIRDLADSNSIDRKLLDEQEDHFQAAVSAELAAGEAINAALQKETSAASRVKQARADQKYAVAEVAVAKAKLARTRVLLDYTIIRSPYNGIVTRRHFLPGHDGRPGDFIRSADQGETTPLFTVERADVMRVVVQVPERDVPFVDVGDAVELTVDALPGTVFKTTTESRVEVSRLARSEDPHTRMMRVEVDVKNLDGKLRNGMFGRVTIVLQAGEKTAVRVPSAALFGKAEGGKATVRVVRDDVAQIVPVRYGADNGAEVEIVSGLTVADRVVVRASGPVENGTPVALKDSSSVHLAAR